MPRRLIALAFVLAGANTAIADDMKMPRNSGDLKMGASAPPPFQKERKSPFFPGTPLGRAFHSSPENAGRL
jgi:hypothetical protein